MRSRDCPTLAFLDEQRIWEIESNEKIADDFCSQNLSAVFPKIECDVILPISPVNL